MYDETGLLFPYIHNFSQDFQQLEDYCNHHKDNASMSTICEYDLGGEGDLFKAPELIIQDPVLSMDPMTAAISMISCGEDVLTPSGGLKIGDDTVQNEQLLSDVFYECKKDLMEMAAVMEGGDNQKFSDVLLDIKTLPPLRIEENQVMQELVPDDVGLSKSVSSGCLSGMDWIPGASVKQPSFLDFPGIDFTSAYGMRRAFSEGDIKALSNGNMGLIHSPRPLIMSNCTSDARKEKLSRYRDKKNRRNFGRKIKYACRKALADSQPRVRGRFAKTEESPPSSSSSDYLFKGRSPL
ncbi:Zinc finger protein CO3 [Linum perenne]